MLWATGALQLAIMLPLLVIPAVRQLTDAVPVPAGAPGQPAEPAG